MIKVAEDGGPAGQGEIADLQEGLEHLWGQIQDCEDRTDKCVSTEKLDDEQRLRTQEKFDRLLKAGKGLDISPEDIDRQENPAVAHMRETCMKTKQRQKIRRDCMENTFQVKGRDLCAQAKKLQSQVRDVQAEIDRKYLFVFL